ncbi:MAG TPA: hypothetical protein VNA89_10330, partial [Gemmatimonadaceae bacterium]|nr:hypothetical protein [Gemmatimonadaceae bacterium]
IEGALPTSPACRQYVCHPGSGRSRIATAAVSPDTSTRAALRSSISTGRLAVACAVALARWETGWAPVVAGVPPTASAPTSAHRPAMVAAPDGAGGRVLWLDALTVTGTAVVTAVAVSERS